MTDRRFIDSYSVILLDMGNTFMFDVDRFGADADYYSTYRAAGGTELGREEVCQRMTHLVEHMFEDYRSLDSSDSFGTVREYLRAIPHSEKLPEREIALLEHVFAHHEAGAIPIGHVKAILELAETHTLGIVSNVWAPSRFFEEKLEDAGILEVFDVRVWSSDHGCLKPSALLFNKALSSLGTDADRAVYVGDDPFRDIGGAKAVGMDAVWIENQRHPMQAGVSPPNLIIKSLLDLPSV